jgi:hypothetical protein
LASRFFSVMPHGRVSGEAIEVIVLPSGWRGVQHLP